MNNNIDKFNSLINKVLSKHYQVRNDSKVKSKAKIQIRTFENRLGVVGIFQKSLNFKFWDHMGL